MTGLGVSIAESIETLFLTYGREFGPHTCVHVSEQHNPAALLLAYPPNHARRPPHASAIPPDFER